MNACKRLASMSLVPALNVARRAVPHYSGSVAQPSRVWLAGIACSMVTLNSCWLSKHAATNLCTLLAAAASSLRTVAARRVPSVRSCLAPACIALQEG